jgi:putative PIN family toxin of toxin-antitoxin system
MKIVIDTNVIASAMFFGGRPRELLELLVSHKLDAYATADIITEYQETAEELCLRYPEKTVRLPLTVIISAIKMIKLTTVINICRDPDDDKFIECAIDAKCLYIISGDKDLLSIGNYHQVQIVTVSEFFSRFQSSISDI